MRNLTTITKNLLIINVLAFFAQVVFEMRGVDLSRLFGLHFFLASEFEPWQLVTYMFMHGGWTHLFFNMFALWMFGCAVENAWGEKRFLQYYIICGVGAGLCQELSQYVQYLMMGLSDYQMVNTPDGVMTMDAYLNLWTTVGASGAVYGLLLGFGLTYPEERIFIFPIPFPIKGKWFVFLYAGVELFAALGTNADGVAHVAHLGGMLFGYLMIRYWRRRYLSSSYGGWDGYEIRSEEGFIDKIRKGFNNLASSLGASFTKKHGNSHRTTTSDRTKNADWEYNKKEKEKENEMDRILEKVSRSGYESLTDEEKRKLFDRR